ncbi:glycosyltransferase family 9 protein [Cognatitamlana onchidii]|uniref:glycosyltransferase family 9 protein n=1 Tax=Cognatitamlana onchidii TaxID=2562860 RepID=UPI0010A64989|nr:glycosyltransferase family 9 protein [Algibacter onchidii]
MGDVAMTVPVLRALNKQYPDVHLTILTREFFKPFFRDLCNTQVYAAQVNKKHKGVFGLYRLAKELKNIINFYAVADLHNVLRSKLLRQFMGCDLTAYIDKGRADKKALVSGKAFKQLKTTHQRYADVFEALGFPLDLSKPFLPERVVLNDELSSFLVNKDRKSIGIAPFAAHQGKVYPLGHMEEVVLKLSNNYNVVLIGGGKREIELLDKIEVKSPNIKSIGGKLNLNDELDLISNLDVMLSMDSGNAHIAAMLGVKVVTIWGVTHPFAGFSPFNQPKHHAILADKKKYPLIPTSIYGNKYPNGYKEAAGTIAPDTIVAKVISVLED